MRTPPFAAALAAVFVLSSPSFADVDPTLAVNGVTGNNNTVVTVLKESTVQVTLTGTPGAPFALLMSAYAKIGQAQGFYLTPWAPPLSGIHSPIQPVLDGIGSGYLATQLGLPSNDIAPTSAVPFFRFDATGTLQFTAPLPAVLPLLDFDPSQPAGYPYGPGQPIPYPLAENFALFLQVVTVDTQTLALRVGNGVQFDFLGGTFGATIALSTGLDANPASATLGQQQTLATVVDADLGDTTFGTPTPASDFTGTFGGMTDVWMIQLAGRQEAVAAASTVPTSGPDFQFTQVQDLASSPDFSTGERVARDNENPEFPRIRLPGGRQLFHWRNGGTNPVTYGFGVLFEETGTYRNLVPSSFGTFSETSTRSPWEVEVAVTPDGDRAVVTLDRSSDIVLGAPVDRVFVLHLEPNGTFTNGQPIVEIAPPNPEVWRRVYEGSVTFTTGGTGGWVAWMLTSTSTSGTETLLPNDFWRFNLSPGPSVLVNAVSAVFPAGALSFNRIMKVNEDRNTLCVVAGTSSIDQDVYSVTSITPISWVPTNITQFPSPQRIAPDGAASDGTTSFSDISQHGTIYAGCRQTSSTSFLPFFARTDGFTAGIVTDIVRDTSVGGLYDLDDFPASQGLHLTDDGQQLLFHQGRIKAGAASDASDLFVADLGSGTVQNLTRTLTGAPYDQNPLAKLNGPWDVTNPSFDAPTVDYGGSFLAPDRRHRFFFRDRHLAASDVFNIYAVDVEPGAGGTNPSFAITNVTGTEFEPSFGVPRPTTGTADTISSAGFFQEQTPSYLHPQRVGGVGPLRDFYYFTAAFASGGSSSVQHLFLLDSANPGPALQVTKYGPTSTPFTTSHTARITSVTPHPTELNVAYVLHHDNDMTKANQELIVYPLIAGSLPVTVPNPGAPPTFTRSITAGSIHWLPGTTSALVYSDGLTPRPTGFTDGISTFADSRNPIDATPWFFTFADPTNPRKIIADAPVGSARSTMIWSVR